MRAGPEHVRRPHCSMSLDKPAPGKTAPFTENTQKVNRLWNGRFCIGVYIYMYICIHVVDFAFHFAHPCCMFIYICNYGFILFLTAVESLSGGGAMAAPGEFGGRHRGAAAL